MKQITVAQLRTWGACDPRVELFRTTFGEAADITLENTQRSIDAGLNFGWVARQILHGPALEEFRSRCEVDWAEYTREREIARRMYFADNSITGHEYDLMWSVALTKFLRATAAIFVEIAGSEDV